MDKKLEARLDAESMTSVNVKEYAPSEAFSAEPPPAYQRPPSTAVQVARIAAVTVVLVSVILGAFIFASAWVQANSACQDALNEQLARMDQMLEDRAAMGPQYQSLIGEPQQGEAQQGDSADAASSHSKREEPRSENAENDIEKDSTENPPVNFKLPLQLDFDELAGALMERNQRSRMNCVVEKRRAEEVVDHQPRTVRLPFGVNLTTDPRYEHVSGERMAIFCESGNDQRHVPMDQQQIVVQQVQVPWQQQQPQQQQQQQHEMQRQEMQRQQIIQHLQQLHEMQQMQQMQQQQQQQQQQQRQFGPPPPPQQMPIQVLPMSQAEARGFQQQHTPLVSMHVMHAPQHESHQEAHHEPQHVPQHEMRQGRQFIQIPPSARDQQGMPLVQAAMTVEVEGRSLTPQQLQHLEQLQQLQQLQSQDGPQVLPLEVVEARAFQHPQQAQQPQGPPAPLPADTLRPPYQRLPFHAVPPQEPEESQRPHYLQPRSVDAVLRKEKQRVRRCACDCNC